MTRQGYAPGSWSQVCKIAALFREITDSSIQVAVERTKPNGRIIGIDIIPAQPPKGVSTIQGNFLSKEVQEEVKRFLNDPKRGRPQQQLYLASTDGPHPSTPDSILVQESYIDMERQADTHNNLDEKGAAGKKSRRQLEDDGKTVDVVLSDMSAPWEQTTGFWKRSLSVPYIRMMNTSGIPFRDHAGSMVSPNL